MHGKVRLFPLALASPEVLRTGHSAAFPFPPLYCDVIFEIISVPVGMAGKNSCAVKKGGNALAKAQGKDG